MDRKDRDYREFFEASDGGKSEQLEKLETQNKPTYYSYGPFHPGHREAEQETESVSITEPKELRKQPEEIEGQWTYPQKKRSIWKSSFAGFMAGVLVISSLMFASDYFNLFTRASAGEIPTIQESNVTTNSSGGSGIRNASIQVVQPETVADIAEQSNPAVVLIETYGKSSRSFTPQDDIFHFFFGTPRSQSESREMIKTGAGSGFIFDSAGYIITNEHVVRNAEEIKVTVLGHKEPYTAELLGSDFDLDLAVLKIKGDKEFPVLPFGDSSEMRPGDWVTAIGNPQGFNHSVSVGVLSALERQISIQDQASRQTRSYEHLLQTDAAINPGNSGGPLLNLKGEVIGINTAVSTQAQGIGFAIPSSTVLQVIDHLKEGKPIPRPYIGVELDNISEAWLDELKLKDTNGAIIMSVFANSPAARSGLQPYDVILEVNGEKIENTAQVVAKVQQAEIGDRIDLKISRNGQILNKAVIVGDKNA